MKHNCFKELLNGLGSDHPLSIVFGGLQEHLKNASEPCICEALISLTCDNPLSPRLGEDLWQAILDHFGTTPDFRKIFQDVAERLDELKALRMPNEFQIFLDTIGRFGIAEPEKVWQAIIIITDPRPFNVDVIWQKVNDRWAIEGEINYAVAAHEIRKAIGQASTDAD